MKNFKQLQVWQKAIAITKATYKLTEKFPTDERFGLTSQMNRAAISIASNIAEGSSRKSQKDYYRFLEIALGSVFELETQLLVAIEVSRVTQDEQTTWLLDQLDQEQKMLMAFMEKISQ